jgi:nitrogen fixation protein FixH
MKINWGTKIAAFYISFVAFILVMVVMAFGEKYELVTEDYYQQELEFQNKIDKSTNAFALDDKLKITIKGNSLIMKFPNSLSATEGTINFFRPSDENADFEEKIVLKDNLQLVDLKKFLKGKYIVKTDWKNGDEEYFQEDVIFIP